MQAVERSARQAQQRSARRRSPGGESIGGNGTIPIPANVPEVVQKVIAGANEIADFPYVFGGGHASFVDNAYDCSGSVSYALAAGGLLSAPETSGELESWGVPGPGRYITVFANAGHTYMYVDGILYDTAGRSGVYASRWQVGRRTTPATSCATGRGCRERRDAHSQRSAVALPLALDGEAATPATAPGWRVHLGRLDGRRLRGAVRAVVLRVPRQGAQRSAAGRRDATEPTRPQRRRADASAGQRRRCSGRSSWRGSCEAALRTIRRSISVTLCSGEARGGALGELDRDRAVPALGGHEDRFGDHELRRGAGGQARWPAAADPEPSVRERLR